MGTLEEKRFQLGWIAVILMLGVAILLGYFGLGLYAAGAFFFGLGLIVVALSLAIGKREMMLTGAGVVFAIFGGAVLLISAGAGLMLVLGGILAGAALAAFVYVAAKK